jgi:hypothetical protein
MKTPKFFLSTVRSRSRSALKAARLAAPAGGRGKFRV